MKSAIVLALCVTACQGAHPPMRSGDAFSSAGITFDFDGVSYSGAPFGTATLQMYSAGGDQLGMVVSDSNATLTITVSPATPQSKIATGTFTTSTTLPVVTFYFASGEPTWSAAGSAGSGTIELMSTEPGAIIDGVVAGTFSASLVGSAGSGALTNGIFDLAVN